MCEEASLAIVFLTRREGGHMGGRAIRRLEAMSERAERDRRLIDPASPADHMAARRLADRHELAEPIPGLFTRPAHWGALSPCDRALHLMRSCAGRHPGWTFTGAAGLLAHGVEVPYALVFPLQVAVARGSIPQAGPHLRFRRASFAESEPASGCRVAPFWACAADCLRVAPFSLGLAVADAVLRHTGMPAHELGRLLQGTGAHRPGIRRAMLIASHVDARAENGGESYARGLMIEEGFLIPDLQVELVDPVDPSRCFRVDQFWLLPSGGRIIGELDGKEKYRSVELLQGRTTTEVFLEERQRESRLTLLGYPVLRYTYDDLLVPARLIRLLEAAGIPRSAEASRAWWRAWLRATGSLCDLPLIRPAALAEDP